MWGTVCSRRPPKDRYSGDGGDDGRGENCEFGCGEVFSDRVGLARDKKRHREADTGQRTRTGKMTPTIGGGLYRPAQFDRDPRRSDES